jgi:hypothetical protein
MNRKLKYSLSGIWLLLSLTIFATACPQWNRPKCPRVGVHSCLNNQPHFCSPTGELTPSGDESCAAQSPARVCAVDPSDGRAYCAPILDAGEVSDAAQEASLDQ